MTAFSSRHTAPEFTGERFVPGETDPILALEHYHRYLAAAHFTAGKRVLDIACGEGYGTAFLASNAVSVTGVDIDEASIIAARKTYARATNASFVVGRCEEFQSADTPFDVIVSFETLEHLDEGGQQRFLDNLKRSLTPGGLLILSTPDKAEYGATRAHANEFHKHEFSEQELREVLVKRFRHIALFGQRPITVSGVWNLEKWKDSLFRFHGREALFAEPSDAIRFATPVYLMAFCSDHAARMPGEAGAGSMYYDLSCAKGIDEQMRWAENVGKELDNRTAWALQLQREKESTENMLRALQKEYEERTKWAKSLDEELAKARKDVTLLQKEYEERTNWAKSLDEELAMARKDVTLLQKEYEERTNWAKNLDEQLAKAREHFERLQKEYEERTAWALSLRDENERERGIARQSVERMQEAEAKLAEVERKMQELQMWGEGIDRELRRITASLVYRILSNVGFLPKRG